MNGPDAGAVMLGMSAQRRAYVDFLLQIHRLSIANFSASSTALSHLFWFVLCFVF